MLRIWPFLLAAAAGLWLTEVADWSRTGHPAALTVADAIAFLGLPVPHPGHGEMGDLVSALLVADGGLFCLLLTLAALALETLLAPPSRP